MGQRRRQKPKQWLGELAGFLEGATVMLQRLQLWQIALHQQPLEPPQYAGGEVLFTGNLTTVRTLVRIGSE